MTTYSPDRPGCLAALFRPFQSQRAPSRPVVPERHELPYRLRDDFLSGAELSYYSVLRSVVGPRASICAKVRLADLLFVARPHENRGYFNRIAQRHVDFLLCESSTLQPVLAIELDDSSHRRADREDADEFLEEALEAAALPLLRVRPKAAYTCEEVLAGVRPLLEAIASTPVVQGPSPVTSQPGAMVPNCPKCGIAMVLRTAGRGSQKGSQFYGCSNFPECRQVVPIAPLETLAADAHLQ